MTVSENEVGAMPTARAATPDGAEPVVSGEAGIPIANSGPDWFEVARGLANAIMFQRATRAEHVVRKDGLTRVGMVDLFGCYAVDEAAREFCELAGLPFGQIEAPNEHQAMYMSVTGRNWHHWFTERDEIVAGAGPSPGRGKVDLTRIAQGLPAQEMEARKGGDEGSVHDSPVHAPEIQGEAPNA